MCSIVVQKNTEEQKVSEELFTTNAQQNNKTNKKGCEAHEECHDQHPSISHTTKRPLPALTKTRYP